MKQSPVELAVHDSHVRLSLWQFGSILLSIVSGTVIVGGLLWTIRLDIARLDDRYSQMTKDLTRIEAERGAVVQEWTIWRAKVDTINDVQTLELRELQVEHRITPHGRKP